MLLYYLAKLKTICMDIPGEIIDSAIDQWRKRLQACVRANGGHFKHLL